MKKGELNLPIIMLFIFSMIITAMIFATNIMFFPIDDNVIMVSLTITLILAVIGVITAWN